MEATEILGVTYTDDGIAVNITRSDAHLIEEGDKLTFVCDEMEHKDLLGSIPEFILKDGREYTYEGRFKQKIFLQPQDNQKQEIKIWIEDFSFLLKENCWKIHNI